MTSSPNPPGYLEPIGALDAQTADAFARSVKEQVAEGHHDLVVTLERVTSLDSAGVKALVAGLQYVRAHEGTLRILCTKQRVLRVLRLTGLHKVLAISSEEETLPTAG